MSVVINKERQVITELIELYKDLPCLWDLSSNSYKYSHQQKAVAWEILREKYREVVPNANIDTVKKKLETLKHCYQREAKKVKDSRKRSGSGLADLHRPNLWYYELLTFLEKKHESARSGVDSLQSEDEENLEPETDCRKRKNNSDQQDFDQKKEKLVDTVQHFFDTDKTDSQINKNTFGSHVEQQLDRIKESEQRDLAERLIGEVLFLGKSNKLTFHTKITTPLVLNTIATTHQLAHTTTQYPYDSQMPSKFQPPSPRIQYTKTAHHQRQPVMEPIVKYTRAHSKTQYPQSQSPHPSSLTQYPYNAQMQSPPPSAFQSPSPLIQYPKTAHQRQPVMEPNVKYTRAHSETQYPQSQSPPPSSLNQNPYNAHMKSPPPSASKSPSPLIQYRKIAHHQRQPVMEPNIKYTRAHSETQYHQSQSPPPSSPNQNPYNAHMQSPPPSASKSPSPLIQYQKTAHHQRQPVMEPNVKYTRAHSETQYPQSQSPTPSSSTQNPYSSQMQSPPPSSLTQNTYNAQMQSPPPSASKSPSPLLQYPKTAHHQRQPVMEPNVKYTRAHSETQYPQSQSPPPSSPNQNPYNAQMQSPPPSSPNRNPYNAQMQSPPPSSPNQNPYNDQMQSPPPSSPTQITYSESPASEIAHTGWEDVASGMDQNLIWGASKSVLDEFLVLKNNNK